MADIVVPIWNLARTFFVETVQPSFQVTNPKSCPIDALFPEKLEQRSKKARNTESAVSIPQHCECSSVTVEVSQRGDRVEMKKVFDLFDENKDGLVCAKDLTSLMRRIGFEGSREEMCALVKAADINRDDFVDFEEFLSLHDSLFGKTFPGGVSRRGEDEDGALREAFLLFDKNNDGQINVEELQQMLLGLGLREGRSRKTCQRMIERVDSDGNGTVDFSEFEAMMSSKEFQPRSLC